MFRDFGIWIDQFFDSHEQSVNDHFRAVLHALKHIEKEMHRMGTTKEQFDEVFVPFLLALTTYQTNVGAYVAAATAAIAAGYPTDLTAEAFAVDMSSAELSASAKALAAAQTALPPEAS